MRFRFRSVTLWCGVENIHRMQDLYVISGRIIDYCCVGKWKIIKILYLYI